MSFLVMISFSQCTREETPALSPQSSAQLIDSADVNDADDILRGVLVKSISTAKDVSTDSLSIEVVQSNYRFLTAYPATFSNGDTTITFRATDSDSAYQVRFGVSKFLFRRAKNVHDMADSKYVEVTLDDSYVFEVNTHITHAFFFHELAAGLVAHPGLPYTSGITDPPDPYLRARCGGGANASAVISCLYSKADRSCGAGNWTATSIRADANGGRMDFDCLG